MLSLVVWKVLHRQKRPNNIIESYITINEIWGWVLHCYLYITYIYIYCTQTKQDLRSYLVPLPQSLNISFKFSYPFWLFPSTLLPFGFVFNKLCKFYLFILLPSLPCKSLLYYTLFISLLTQLLTQLIGLPSFGSLDLRHLISDVLSVYLGKTLLFI